MLSVARPNWYLLSYVWLQLASAEELTQVASPHLWPFPLSWAKACQTLAETQLLLCLMQSREVITPTAPAAQISRNRLQWWRSSPDIWACGVRRWLLVGPLTDCMLDIDHCWLPLRLLPQTMSLSELQVCSNIPHATSVIVIAFFKHDVHNGMWHLHLVCPG